MRVLSLICLAPMCLFLLSGCGIEKAKLYGVWVLESGPDKLPKGTLMEFSADGKLRMGMESLGNLGMLEVGSYEISGKIITLKIQGKDGKARITELTDDKMVWKDDAEPKVAVFKKK